MFPSLATRGRRGDSRTPSGDSGSVPDPRAIARPKGVVETGTRTRWEGSSRSGPGEEPFGWEGEGSVGI